MQHDFNAENDSNGYVEATKVPADKPVEYAKD
jgi:hypothetical protein